MALELLVLLEQELRRQVARKLEAEGGLHRNQPQDTQEAPVCLMSEESLVTVGLLLLLLVKVEVEVQVVVVVLVLVLVVLAAPAVVVVALLLLVLVLVLMLVLRG